MIDDLSGNAGVITTRIPKHDLSIHSMPPK